MANFYGSLIGFGAGGVGVAWTVATGGTITTDGSYKVHKFTGDGTFEITTLGADAIIEYLVIAGGGSGAGAPGTYGGGGGGAGGYLAATGFAVTAVSYDIQVGAGGAAVAVGSSTMNDGEDSHISHASITDIIATGGGAGTPAVVGDGQDGGSGGGVGWGVHTGGSGTVGQGNDGGDSGGGTAGSGGGGAGGAGDDVDGGDPYGEGGIGVQNDIVETGTDLWYAGGGGGAYTAGGSGVGGTGTITGTSTAATAGAVNTGSGGGGTVESTFASGAGGSGIVVIRYQFQV